MAKSVDTGSMYLLLWQEKLMCQWYSLSTDVIITIIRMMEENPYSPHSPTRKASSWSILKDEMVEVNRIKKTILVTGIMLSEEVPVGKPLEKRMQILSLSRHLWIRYSLTARQRTLPTTISPSIRRGSTSVDSPWAA